MPTTSMGTEPSLRLYDTLTAGLAPLVLRPSGEIGIYCCGPTVYDVAHVGHARAALAPDLLVRHLRADGFRVKYVRNITDVEDKILKRSSERGIEPLELSREMAKLYQEDIAALGCVTPDVEPKVSEHIPQIIAIIEKLIAEGAAYVVDMKDGTRDVYYAVRAFPSYGKLSKRKIEDLQVGARIEANEDKKDPLDFALWKGCAKDAWGWDSPWGKGRPGWHIECSAMSATHLGHGFDVHTGGMDLIFPHHENEIAQSEGAFPDKGPFARTWIHNGFVNVDKEKMAKSLGNFVTIRDVYERNDPEALRYFLLTVHYRGPIAFDTEKLESGRVIFPGVIEAEKRVDYLYATLVRLRALVASESGDGGSIDGKGTIPPALAPMHALAADAPARAKAALDDDLNSPVVLSVLADLAKAANEVADLVVKRKKDAAIVKGGPTVAGALERAIVAVAGRVGLLGTPAEAFADRTRVQRLRVRGLTADAIDAKLRERDEARAAKDWAKGDAIRAELSELGVEIADGPTGTSWRIHP
jgi:cysteinyl-tRNA synthetase